MVIFVVEMISDVVSCYFNNVLLHGTAVLRNCCPRSSRKHAYKYLNPHNPPPPPPPVLYSKIGVCRRIHVFLFLLKNIDCGYSLEPPRRGGSNEYQQSMFWAEIWKISKFLSEYFQFLEVKFSTYLNRRVFVMGILARSDDRRRNKNLQQQVPRNSSHCLLYY